MPSSPTAVIDASIVFAADRWLRKTHRDPTSEYYGKYRPGEDKYLFREFLHDLVLYDSIILTHGSGYDEIDDIFALFDQINNDIEFELLTTHIVNLESQIEPILEGTCQLIKAAYANDVHERSALISVPVPQTYRTAKHHDYETASQIASTMDLDRDLIPLLLFTFRGLCYAGYANQLARSEDGAAVYLAAPGRMLALSRVLNHKDIQRMEYPRRGFNSLVDLLNLPSSGLDFTSLESLSPYDTSSLAAFIEEEGEQPEPREVLNRILRLRESSEARSLRLEWTQRILDTSQLSAIGRTYAQTAENVKVGRDLIQKQNQIIIGWAVRSKDGEMKPNENRSKQTIRNVRLRKNASQYSDADNSTQTADDVRANSLKQTSRSKQPELNILGRYRARGLYAVIGLIVFITIVLAARVLIDQL
jgi:hypothetical protein